jgi:hypothetical protein
MVQLVLVILNQLVLKDETLRDDIHYQVVLTQTW